MVEDTTGADIMFVIIPIVHIADHDAGYAGMDEFIVAEIDAYMGYFSAFSEGMEEYEIAFLQFVAPDSAGGLILFPGSTGQGRYAIYGGHEEKGEGGAVNAIPGGAAIMIGGAIPVIHEAQ